MRVEVDTGPGEGIGALWDEGLWDEDRWGSEDPDWVDFTAYVLEVSIRQGAERWGERVQAGTASVTVDNTTGFSLRRSVWSTSGSVRSVQAGGCGSWLSPTRIRVYGCHCSQAGSMLSTAILPMLAMPSLRTCKLVDFMGDWAAYNPFETTATGSQTNRCAGRMLPSTGTDGRQTNGTSRSGSTMCRLSTLSETTLEECQTAADAEGGVFYCSKDGLATFKNRDWLTTDTRSTVIQGYIGYDEVPTGAQAAHIVETPATSWELARVVNHAAYAREGGTAQEVIRCWFAERFRAPLPQTDRLSEHDRWGSPRPRCRSW